MAQTKPMSWWDAARAFSPLTVAELDVSPPLIDLLQAETGMLTRRLDAPIEREIRFPGDIRLGLERRLGPPSFLEIVCTDLIGPGEHGIARAGIRHLRPEFISPIDARWLAERGWPAGRGAAIPWLTSATDAWRDPLEEDVIDLIRTLRWIRYQTDIESKCSPQAA